MVRVSAEVEGQVLEALASNLSHVAAAQLVGVSARTVQRMVARPEFTARLARRRAVKQVDFVNALDAMESDALAVLREAMVADERRDRLRAAALWFSLSSRARQEFDFGVRLQAVEARTAATAGDWNADDDADGEVGA